MNKEVYLLCLSYVDNFEVLGVYTDYLKAEEDLNNLIKYSVYDEPEQVYKIYCLELDKYYNYNKFDECEMFSK